MNPSETFISVDIEASGPIPGEFSMLSLGACIVGASEQSFYVELKPITINYQPEALQVAGFDLDDLAAARRRARRRDGAVRRVAQARDPARSNAGFRRVPACVRLDVCRVLFSPLSRPESIRHHRRRSQIKLFRNERSAVVRLRRAQHAATVCRWHSAHAQRTRGRHRARRGVRSNSDSSQRTKNVTISHRKRQLARVKMAGLWLWSLRSPGREND